LAPIGVDDDCLFLPHLDFGVVISEFHSLKPLNENSLSSPRKKKCGDEKGAYQKQASSQEFRL
jgi:hypothetical protein